MTASGRSAWHDLETLPGLAPAVAEQVRAHGIETLEELCGLSAGAARVLADRVSGISAVRLRDQVIPQAGIALLDGGAEPSRALIEGGVSTYLALMAAPTATITRLTGYDDLAALRLQLQAARGLTSFKVVMRVLDKAGRPVRRPVLEIADAGFAVDRPTVDREGDTAGWVGSGSLLRGRAHHLSLLAAKTRRSMLVRAPAGPVRSLTVRLSGAPRPLEPHPDRPLIMGGPITAVFDAVPLRRVNEGELFRVASGESSPPVLVSIVRQVHGLTVISRTVDYTLTDLSGTLASGTVVAFHDGHFRKGTAAERKRADRIRGVELAKRVIG